MARTKLFQTSFTSGQLDQNLMGRIDSPKYYQGASVIENGYCMPQGGVQKRGGLQHLDELVYGDQEVRLIPYFFGAPTGVDQAFVIVLSAGNLEVRDLEGNSVVNLDTPWVNDNDIYEIDYAQSYDYLIFTHQDYPPQRLIRVQDTWNLDNIAFVKIPDYAFPNAIQAPTVAYDKQNIEAQNISKGDTFSLVYNGNTSGNITWDWIASSPPTFPFQTNTDDAETLRLAVENFLRGAVGNDDVIVTVNYTIVVYNFQVSGGETEFSFWKKFSGLKVTFTGVNEGLGLLISEVTAKLKVTAIGGGVQPAPEEEPVWSNERGWPISVNFYENRLFFGGSRSRPSTIWGSRTGRYFDFSYETDSGDVVADDYIDVTLNTDQVNRINHISSGRRLEIFTTGGEFFCPIEGVTPLNFPVVQTGNIGSAGLAPVKFDNTTLFAQRRGDAIRDFVYDFANDKYLSNVTSSLATSLINSPKQMVVQQGVGTDQSDYMYLLNNDGTMSVYSSDALNGVSAWTKFTTVGEWVSICESAGDIYVITRRPNGSATSTVLALEKLVFDSFLDGEVVRNTTGTTGDGSRVTGLTHLANKEVTILTTLDEGGSILLTGTVGEDGTLELSDTPINTVVNIGLPYRFEVTSMPITINGVQGQVVYDRKKVNKAILNIQNSYGVEVTYNGRERAVRSRRLPLDQFNQNPPITGYTEVFLRGYSRDTRVGVVQNVPFNCTLISLGVELSL